MILFALGNKNKNETFKNFFLSLCNKLNLMQELKFNIFDSPGKQNTKETLELAKINADLLNIKKIVIASTGGYTINQAISIFDPSIYKLIVVTHNYGFREGLEQEFPEKLRDELEKQGIKVITGV